MQDVSMDRWLLAARGLGAVTDANVVAGWLRSGPLPVFSGTADVRRPYGRHVLFAGGGTEVMVAVWTRGVPCLPHDHGGGVGAVRVLAGRGWNERWARDSHGLSPTERAPIAVGDVLPVTRDLVHVMADDGGQVPLTTLHVYVNALAPMQVYDPETSSSFSVPAGHGAWRVRGGAAP